MYRRKFCLAVALLSTSTLLAQEFKIANRTVQVHGFASQGFVYTAGNNWLTMGSTQGSAAMTDMGLNMSSQVSDRLRVGAQVYDRNLGQLGQWHPSVDWAVADYRFTNWFGVRAGKVKTVIGLHNETQDLEFLDVFALLPQSVYPTDLRDATIAHWGMDFYGTLPARARLGTFSYAAYTGYRSDSIYSGYPYLLQVLAGIRFKRYGGLVYGGDLRWQTPLKGFLVGISRLNEHISGDGTISMPVGSGNSGGLPPPLFPNLGTTSSSSYEEHSRQDWTNQFYGEYRWRRLTVDSEYRRYLRDQSVFNGLSVVVTDVRGWYISGSYRPIKRLEVGSYYSRYTIDDNGTGSTSMPANHIYDKVVSGRVDLNRFWNLKIEGHFMDGYGYGAYPDGFYASLANQNSFKPQTNALVLKTGFHF